MQGPPSWYGQLHKKNKSGVANAKKNESNSTPETPHVNESTDLKDDKQEAEDPDLTPELNPYDMCNSNSKEEDGTEAVSHMDINTSAFFVQDQLVDDNNAMNTELNAAIQQDSIDMSKMDTDSLPSPVVA